MLNWLVSLIADLPAFAASTKFRTFLVVMLALALIWAVLMLLR